MNLKSTKNQLSNAFTGELKEAIKQLEGKFSAESIHLNTFRILKGNYDEVKRREMQNRMTYEDFSREMSNTRHSFLSLIELLDEEDLVENASNFKAETHLPILLLTPQSENIPSFESFFKTFNFTNVDIQLINTERTHLDYDIIIFDNQDLLAENSRNLRETDRLEIQKRSQLMNEILIASDRAYFIHFGNTLFWLNHHRNRCNAANSKFTLHSNIKNLIEFIKSYQV